MKLISPASYPDLIDLIDEAYINDVKQIVSAAANDRGDILCLVQNGKEQLAVKISDDIEIKLFNPQEPARQTAKFSSPDSAMLDRIASESELARNWLDKLQAIESFDELVPDSLSAEFAQSCLDRLNAVETLGELDFDISSLLGDIDTI